MDRDPLRWPEGHIHLVKLCWTPTNGLRWSDCQVHLLGWFWNWFAWIHVEHPNMCRERKSVNERI
jgi:hypothetical protein